MQAISVIGLLLLALAGATPAAAGPKKTTLPPASAAMLATARAAKASGCSTTVLTHVYKPQRLTVYSKCLAVTGTLVDATATRKHASKDGVRHEGDGDTHGWLKPDATFAALLNRGNVSHEGGNLVFEIVCFTAPHQADAVSSCPRAYHNAVTLPPVGSHVEVLGAFVQDDNHAHWMELHPVTRIRIVPITAHGKVRATRRSR